MPKVEYKGETPSKSIARVLVWQQHAHLLKPTTFKTSPHVFLASRVAGDVNTLRDMGVPPGHIWAVEKERSQYQSLLERRKKEGFQLFPQKVESVMLSYPDANIRSVYLDYCGNLQGTASTTRRIAALLPEGSALSITLFLGREHENPGDRESALLRQIRKSATHQVTVVQSILYVSASDDDTIGSPMGTWTFYVGPSTSRGKMKFDLRNYNRTSEVIRFWQAAQNQARIRSEAAVKANLTRAAV